MSMRPREHLVAIAKKYPNAWKMAENMRANRGKDLPWWPEWCYLPCAGAYTIVANHWNVPRLTTIEQVHDLSKIAALAPWRITQGIYRFDPDLLLGLMATPVEGNLPHDVLFRLPEWCIYIETPNTKWLGDTLYGYFVHLEYDVNDGRTELRLLLDTDEQLFPVPLHLGDWTLAESIKRFIDESIKQRTQNALWLPAFEMNAEQQREFKESIDPLISLVLYICSTNADIGDGGKRPHNPTPRKTKRGPRIFPANQSTVWNVGVRVGAALRRAATRQASSAGGGTHASPRPHIRRAHWHGYWRGPRDGERQFILHWLSPIPVGARQEDMPAVIHPIKGEDS